MAVEKDFKWCINVSGDSEGAAELHMWMKDLNPKGARAYAPEYPFIYFIGNKDITASSAYAPTDSTLLSIEEWRRIVRPVERKGTTWFIAITEENASIINGWMGAQYKRKNGVKSHVRYALTEPRIVSQNREIYDAEVQSQLEAKGCFEISTEEFIAGVIHADMPDYYIVLKEIPFLPFKKGKIIDKKNFYYHFHKAFAHPEYLEPVYASSILINGMHVVAEEGILSVNGGNCKLDTSLLHSLEDLHNKGIIMHIGQTIITDDLLHQLHYLLTKSEQKK